jgi:hypothetical protein
VYTFHSKCHIFSRIGIFCICFPLPLIRHISCLNAPNQFFFIAQPAVDAAQGRDSGLRDQVQGCRAASPRTHANGTPEHHRLTLLSSAIADPPFGASRLHVLMYLSLPKHLYVLCHHPSCVLIAISSFTFSRSHTDTIFTYCFDFWLPICIHIQRSFNFFFKKKDNTDLIFFCSFWAFF